MKHNISETTGRKVRFHELYEKDRIRIVIPKIQRDFAYGRPSKTVSTNRSRFLDSICEAIDPNLNETKPLELDFIYGRLNNNVVPREFEPIDGQQRLTILFLLYLYIGKRCNLDGNDLEFLKHFTYKTRESSQNFCELIVNIHPRYFQSCPRGCIFSENCDHYKNIVDYIKDQWWFNTSSSIDPTISSMLGMLDAIDERFGSYDNSEMLVIWKLLRENIDFWLLTLEDLNATDDLYIKMNSRGKKLTEFEHFKAELERYSDNSKWLSMRIDTAWTNMLWQYRKTKDSPEEVDPKKDTYTDNGLSENFLNLFYRMIVMEAVKKGYLAEYPGDNTYNSNDILNVSAKVLPGHPEILDRIEKVLDYFCGLKSISSFFSNIFSNCFAQSEDDIPTSYDQYRVFFSDTIDFLQLACHKNETAFKDTLILEAIFEYAFCRQSGLDISESTLKDRLRILRNLQNNLQVHHYEMQGLLNSTAEFMRTGNLNIIAEDNAYTKIQRDQEAFKRNVWKANHSEEDWLTLITLENTYFLYGNLSPIMSGESSLRAKHLRGFLRMVSNEPSLNSFRRSLLTFGDYSTDFKGVKKYASDDWLRWYNEIFISRNRTFAPAFLKMLDSIESPSDIDSRNRIFEKTIREYCHDCAKRRTYPWLYYMVSYNQIFNNPRAIRGLYRSGDGKYDHKMVTGSKGKSWNPYLLALVDLLPNASLDNWYDYLYFNGKEIWISERELTIKYSNDIIVKRTIPCDCSGTDSIDRIDFARRILLNLPLTDTATPQKRFKRSSKKKSCQRFRRII